MIHVTPPPEPPDFEELVRKPGTEWLEQNPKADRPKSYWLEVRFALADAFGNLCGYGAMYEPVGTVDHFISWDECKRKGEPHLAYEWSNYRFASGWINSSKHSLESDQILDPFEVEDDWFEIQLPSLQLTLGDNVPDHIKGIAEFVLTRLHLRDDERVIRQRAAWYYMYTSGELTLEG